METQANDSLAVVQEVQILSEASINTANNLQMSLQLASNSAKSALYTANNTREQALEQVEVSEEYKITFVHFQQNKHISFSICLGRVQGATHCVISCIA